MNATWSEIRAVQLLIRAGEVPLTNQPLDWNALADRIILLAEKIKAERLTAAMYRR